MKMVYIFFVSMLIAMCENNHTNIDSFFIEIEKSVDKNKLLTFMRSPTDSVVYYFKEFENEFYTVYHDPNQIELLNRFFNEIKVENHTETRIYYLCFAFHSRLNHKKINKKEILKNIVTEIAKIKDGINKEIKIFEIEQYKVLQQNNIVCDIGDVFAIMLPVKITHGIKYAQYCRNTPLMQDCSGFDDTLTITGQLLYKKYVIFYYSENIDTSDIIFNLKILKLSDPECEIFDEKYQVGDTIPLHLSAYGRPIK